MICPVCQSKNRPGTLFCSGCGVYLPTGGPLRTAQLPEDELPIMHANPWASSPSSEETDNPIIPLRVKVVSSGRIITLPATIEVTVGRQDTEHGIHPNLDLTTDGGLEGGVSRLHCKIHQRASVYQIEDVGSANGTFLNSERLTPYLPQALRDGDKVQVGRVELEIIVPLSV